MQFSVHRDLWHVFNRSVAWYFLHACSSCSEARSVVIRTVVSSKWCQSTHGKSQTNWQDSVSKPLLFEAQVSQGRFEPRFICLPAEHPHHTSKPVNKSMSETSEWQFTAQQLMLQGVPFGYSAPFMACLHKKLHSPTILSTYYSFHPKVCIEHSHSQFLVVSS